MRRRTTRLGCWQMLLNAGRYPTAASIAILCIEEAPKVSILRRIAVCKDDTERQKHLERVSITSP
jgi:AbiV family abortive infection protein